MENEIIVQFVFFETMGDNNEFISQWDQYSKEMKKIQKIKLQQETGNKKKAKYTRESYNANKEDALKCLHNSQNITNEFLNEV